MSIRKSQMFGGELIFLDFLLVLVGLTYWYITGHYLPLILGFIFLLIYLYADKLYFIALIMGIVTLISIIFFIFYDSGLENYEDVVSQVGISSLYMLVIYLKSRSIFNAD